MENNRKTITNPYTLIRKFLEGDRRAFKSKRCKRENKKELLEMANKLIKRCTELESGYE